MQNIIESIIRKCEEVVVIGFSILCLAIVTYDVFNRYFFGNALPWANEVVKILYIWLCFFALSWSMREGEGGIISLNYFEKRLNGKKKLIILLLKNIITMIFYILFMYSSFSLIKLAYLRKGTTPNLYIPYWIVYSGAFLGILLTFIRTCFQTVKIYKRRTL